MLESITIRNYAIIGEMTARFDSGLNIITGETGAGKSIVVDALELVLGSRASNDMIRAGEDSLEVSGVFTADASLVDGALPVEPEDGLLIVRREVRADGNNRCYINDRPQTLRVLRELGVRLVDFHGQHDHQSLLVVPQHIEYLDGFAGLLALRNEAAAKYRDVTRFLSRIQEIEHSIAQRQRDRELYEFQLGEIDRADINPGEDDELEIQIARLANAAELKTLGWELFQGLSESDGSVAGKLGDFVVRLESAVRSDHELQPWLDKLAELEEQARDVAAHFRAYADAVEDDPSLLADLEERLALIERLKKKYGPTLKDVIAYRERIKSEFAATGHSEEELAELRSALAVARDTLAIKAAELSEHRKDAAPQLAREVEAHLSELGMHGARLVVAIEPIVTGVEIQVSGDSVPVSSQGLDRVEFLMSANPGEPPRPLVKVASGGEISRIMLSLKLALTDANSVPTMVFDEIDVGVSGRIAEAIGLKLRKLTEQRQALVITHLPQIAAMADRHFSARKQTDGERTHAGLVELDREKREREVASLLSGQTLTEAAIAHARQLMNGGGDGD